MWESSDSLRCSCSASLCPRLACCCFCGLFWLALFNFAMFASVKTSHESRLTSFCGLHHGTLVGRGHRPGSPPSAREITTLVGCVTQQSKEACQCCVVPLWRRSRIAGELCGHQTIKLKHSLGLLLYCCSVLRLHSP